MWTLWWERNRRSFNGMELPLDRLKLLFLRSPIADVYRYYQSFYFWIFGFLAFVICIPKGHLVHNPHTFDFYFFFSLIVLTYQKLIMTIKPCSPQALSSLEYPFKIYLCELVKNWTLSTSCIAQISQQIYQQQEHNVQFDHTHLPNNILQSGAI
jgi:hypothetical protein